MDIRDADAVEGLFDGVIERHGRLDVLVNNAGGQFMSPAEAISAKGFRTVTELNVQGTWQMTHAAATKAFIPQRSGKVISVTLSPHHGMPGMVHSGAARAAVENMMRTLSIEWARFGIRLCAVAAGQFDTEVLRTKYPPQVAENVHRTIPLGRLGTPEEMAWMVAYLASPAGDFLSGCVITIDGARDNWFGAWPPTTVDRGVGRAARRGAQGRAPERGSSGERLPERVDERPPAPATRVLLGVVTGERGAGQGGGGGERPEGVAELLPAHAVRHQVVGGAEGVLVEDVDVKVKPERRGRTARRRRAPPTARGPSARTSSTGTWVSSGPSCSGCSIPCSSDSSLSR